jgi:hypothetical protein
VSFCDPAIRSRVYFSTFKRSCDGGYNQPEARATRTGMMWSID